MRLRYATTADLLVKEIELYSMQGDEIYADVRGNTVFVWGAYGEQKFTVDENDTRALSRIAQHIYTMYIGW